MKIDVTTTATLRYAIVEETLSTFWNKLFKGHDARLIINIDPIGNGNETAESIVEMARRYFPEVIYRIPPTAQYIDALKWTWSQVQSEYFFNLEDDYHLVCQLDMSAMLRAFKHDKALALLRLPKGESFGDKVHWAVPFRSKLAIWNGYYYEDSTLAFTGMPSMIRTKWMRGFYPHLRSDLNHEITFRKLKQAEMPIALDWKFGVYTERDTPKTVYDIGVDWRNKKDIRKNYGDRKRKVGFTGWLKDGKPYLNEKSVKE